jgi:hypothetical protein
MLKGLGPISDSVLRFVHLVPFCHNLDLEMCGIRKDIASRRLLLLAAVTIPAQSALDVSLSESQTGASIRTRDARIRTGGI